jgi:hypothetical protein
MGLTMSSPRDRIGDVRRQHRTKYAYVYARDPSITKKITKKKKKTKGKSRKGRDRTGWLRYDLMLLSRFPKKGTSSRFKHLRAKRSGLGPLVGAQEKALIRRDVMSTKKPWSEM